MKQNLSITLDNKQQLVDVCKALSSPIRLDILHFLSEKPAIISDVAAKFELPLSSAALYIKVLENAGLIYVQPIPGSKGSQKLCGVLVNRVEIDMFQTLLEPQPSYLYKESMPVGCYFDYKAQPSCGMVSEVRDLGYEDSSSVFTSPARFTAQLIWLSLGFLEYRFTNAFLKKNKINRVKFSFELCSEALGYKQDWPSDITFSLNGHEIGIIHCDGDYGDRRGKLNPEWWSSASSQYGLLHTIEITTNGCYIDEKPCSSHNILSLGLLENDNIRLKLEVKEDAQYCGGFNLFGEKFGDYPQGIDMELYCY